MFSFCRLPRDSHGVKGVKGKTWCAVAGPTPFMKCIPMLADGPSALSAVVSTDLT